MSAGFRRRKRRVRRRQRCCFDWRGWLERLWCYYPTTVTLVIALSLSLIVINSLERRLQPLLESAARVQTQNTITAVLEESISRELDRQSTVYSDLAHVERGSDGNISAITTDVTGMNQLRGALIEAILMGIDQIDEREISIPVGSLTNSELLWGRGKSIKVKSFTIGTVSAEFESNFLSAGINQTLHRIDLTVAVPITVLLPGSQIDVSVETKVCVAETVIVGPVPNYLQKAYG